MSGITYVPLPNELLVRLIERYQHHYDGPLEHAVESFLERTEDDWDSRVTSVGYVWKQSPLPEGTELRTRYLEIFKTGTLKNGVFHYDGETYSSPNKLCCAMRESTSENAWRMLEIKRPQDVDFRPANTLRH